MFAELNDAALYGSQRPLTLLAELNDAALYGSQRPLTLFAELNDAALYGSQRPLTLFAELNDAALYGSQRQVLGHAVKRISHWVICRKTTISCGNLTLRWLSLDFIEMPKRRSFLRSNERASVKRISNEN
ncbi:hypothetical protein [Leptospira santarosai]|uniref:hypothetical protein n=1 Tax=Leptospira santarosai TaxID=28183 RepID=UPI0012F6F812|nr:hypothetical protein [Leptospira santarosai]